MIAFSPFPPDTEFLLETKIKVLRKQPLQNHACIASASVFSGDFICFRVRGLHIFWAGLSWVEGVFLWSFWSSRHWNKISCKWLPWSWGNEKSQAVIATTSLPCCFLQRLCSSAPAAAVAKADIWVSMARDCVQQLNKFHYSDNFSIEMTQNGTDILPFFPQLLLISRRVFLKK